MTRNMRNFLYSAWDLLWIKVDFIFSTLCSRLSLCFQGCPFGKDFRTSGKCYFKARRSGSIRVGDHVALLAGHRSNRVGLSNPVLLETLGDGVIEIGNYSGGSAVVISSRSNVTLGAHCKLGGNVRIFDHDFHSLDSEVRKTTADLKNVRSKPVNIGDDVFVGTGAIILKGVTIGDRSIIGAGAIVTTDIPADEVWGGNPAVCMRSKRTDNDLSSALSAIRDK